MMGGRCIISKLMIFWISLTAFQEEVTKVTAFQTICVKRIKNNPIYAIEARQAQRYRRNHLPPLLLASAVISHLNTTSGEAMIGAGEPLFPGTTKNKRTTSKNNKTFEKFDYLNHWYPVIWERDLKPAKPTKITLFDVDYVIAKALPLKNGEVIAMVDACPHKSAALSEGRVTEFGYFQCAYHGWTFDGKSGACLEIPQVDKHKSRATDRSNGIAVPAQIVQGMVWLFPGGGLEKALLAPPPPLIPEMDMPGYSVLGEQMRDFPVDWTILLENIMDPDHGLFAHQAVGFDLYSASKELVQGITEESQYDGQGWTITSTVDATNKLLKPNNQKKKKSTAENTTPDLPKKSTTTYIAPSVIYMGRRDVITNHTMFLSAFWVCPTGTGKSRFMATAIGKLPKWFPKNFPPRWFLNQNVNNFLDQDTYLLFTQQRHVLGTESQLTLEQNDDDDVNNHATVPVRKSLYVYRSPSERLGARIGNFLDATVKRVPNRKDAIRDMGGYDKVMRQSVPSREDVLDRYVQHTLITNDSMDVVKNCQLVQRLSKSIAVVPLIIKVLAQFCGDRSWFLSKLISRCDSMLSRRPRVLICSWVVALVSFYLAKKLQKEFYYKYDKSYQERDMDKIPSVWMDR